jgi:hypothetical protein
MITNRGDFTFYISVYFSCFSSCREANKIITTLYHCSVKIYFIRSNPNPLSTVFSYLVVWIVLFWWNVDTTTHPILHHHAQIKSNYCLRMVSWHNLITDTKEFRALWHLALKKKLLFFKVTFFSSCYFTINFFKKEKERTKWKRN